MQDLLELGRRVLAAQPFSVWLEAELTEFKEGSAEITIPITEPLKQQHGFVHGGILSYAADNALTFAGGSVLGPAVVTAEFKINYVRPARGTHVVARATVVHAGQSQAVCRCEVFTVGGPEAEAGPRLCAVAQGTISRLSQPAATVE
jgi:uncharacterized protein (TIGR00369 family)